MAEKKVIELEVKNNAADVKEEFQRLRGEIAKTKEEVDQLTSAYGENSDEVQQAIKQLESLEKAYKDLNKVATDIDATFEQVYGELQPLSTRMGEAEDRLYELTLAGKTNSKEYKELLATVGHYKRTMMETDMVVDGAAMTLSQKMVGAVGGVAAGFEAAQGAMAMFGVESQDLEEVMLKVQSAMAFSQGIQGLLEARDSFKQLGAVIGQTTIGQKLLTAAQAVGAVVMKALNAVMKANPIFLIIAGITAAVAAFKYFTSSTETAEEANEKLNKSLDKQNQLFESNLAKIKKNADNRKRLLEANGASEEVLHKDTLRRLREEENARVSQMKMIEKQNDQRRKLYKRAFEEENYELAKDIQDKIKADNKKYKELALNNKEYQISVKEENKRFNDEQAKEEEKRLEEEQRLAKEALEKRKDLFEKRKENDLKEAQELNDLVKNRENKEIDIIRQASMTKEELAKRMAEQTKKLREEEYNDAQGFLEAQIIQDENNFTARLELLELQRQKELENKELTEGEIAAIEARYAEERKKISDSEKEYKRKNIEFALQNVTQAMSVVSEFASQTQRKYDNLNKAILDNDKLTDKEKQRLLDENNKRAKKAFEVQKAVSIASALIATYQSAVSAYQSQFLPLPDPSSPIRGAIAAAIAVATGLANVKNITAQKFEGASVASSSSSGGGSASAGASGVMSPNFNIVGNAQATNPLAGLGNQPIQAYVVSGEVTTAQSLDRNRINYATFG